MSPKHETLVGRTLEKCKLVAKLGTGGMGSVYLAEHAGLGRKVAVKILPADLCRDPEYVARFKREALTAGRMEHPNIVQVYDVGQAEGRHFLVMQYVDGESLSTIVENLGAMDPRDAARVSAGVLRGLHHAHEQGVVHRDVKPDNVLVSKGDRPLLLDFGLAIEQETSLQITKDGMVVGTPYYLSPEQAQGKKASPRSDIYAAGVSLYYLLTGRRPFTGATALAVLNKHIHEAPVPPIQVNPKIPRVLNDIVLKLMAKNPADRYASAAAAAQALENFLEGKAVDVGLPLKARFAALPPPLRYGVLGGAAALGILVLGGLLVAAFSGSTPPPPPAPSADLPPAPAPPAAPTTDRTLVDLRADAKRVLESNDFSEMPRIIDRYDSFAAITSLPEMQQLAQRSRDEFVAQVRRRAEAEHARLKGGEKDLVARIRALDQFPRPLLTIDDLRDLRGRLREERDHLLELLDVQFQEDEAKLVKQLAVGESASARALAASMEDYAGELRYGKEPRLQRLRKVREEDVPRIERDAADRLVQAYVPIRGVFEAAMMRRDRPGAYAAATGFLKKNTDGRARDEGVSYDALLNLVPDAALSDGRLSNAMLLLSSVWFRAKDEPAFRILADLQDVLDLEWLFRQVSGGVKRLSSGGPEVRLETFGAAGRIGIGPTGLQFTAKSGPPRPINLATLKPADLVLLAAAAEGQTAEEALEGNAQLARAAGVAWLYSPVTDRWLKADHLMARAEQRGMSGPTFRRARLRDVARAKALEAMALARAGGEAKFEESRKLLAELDALWIDDADMKLEIGRATAIVVGAEMRRAGKNHARVKALAKSLFTAHPGMLEDPGLLALFGNAVRQSGDWLTVNPHLQKDLWTASVPAADERAAATGLRLKVGGRLDLAPALAKSVAGFTMQARVNQDAGRPFAAGFFLDGGARKILLRENGEVALLDQVEGRDRVLGAVTLDARPGPGRWFDLAWAQEGDLMVVYYEARPLFARRVASALPSGLALGSDAGANFRSFMLRRP